MRRIRTKLKVPLGYLLCPNIPTEHRKKISSPKPDFVIFVVYFPMKTVAEQKEKIYLAVQWYRYCSLRYKQQSSDRRA
jgi:hypothetical protein